MSEEQRPIKKRPGFSLSNTLRFKPAYDQAIDNLKNPDKINKDVLVLYSSLPSLSPSTFKQRITEGLRWIIDFYDTIPSGMQGKYDAKDYAYLRGLVRITPALEGVLIRFPGSQTAALIDLGIHGDDMSRTSWKQKVINHVDSGEEGKVFILKGLLLTDEDIDWLKNYLHSAGAEYKVEKTSIMIIK